MRERARARALNRKKETFNHKLTESAAGSQMIIRKKIVRKMSERARNVSRLSVA